MAWGRGGLALLLIFFPFRPANIIFPCIIVQKETAFFLAYLSASASLPATHKRGFLLSLSLSPSSYLSLTRHSSVLCTWTPLIENI